MNLRGNFGPSCPSLPQCHASLPSLPLQTSLIAMAKAMMVMKQKAAMKAMKAMRRKKAPETDHPPPMLC